MIIKIVFFVLSIFSVASALAVVFARNPVYSVLSLVLCFFSIACHYILLHAQFLALVHVIVYAGAIMVLFLFVIMLMNLNSTTEPHHGILWKFFGVGLSGLFGLGLLMLVLHSGVKMNPAIAIADGGIGALGRQLFGEYVAPFELSSLLFLAAIVGVVLIGKLAKHHTASHSEGQKNLSLETEVAHPHV